WANTFFNGSSLGMPSVAAIAVYVFISESKNPDFFAASRLLSNPLRESEGYFTMEASVAYVSRKPPGEGSLKWCVRVRKALAFPSNQRKSRCWFGDSSVIKRSLPSPSSSRKKWRMASSPEWPKGGLPISCARHPAAIPEGSSYL